MISHRARHSHTSSSISNVILNNNNNNHSLKNGTSSPVGAASPTAAAAAAAKDFSQYEPIFRQISEDKKTITPFELQDMLEACLPNGEFSHFSSELAK